MQAQKAGVKLALIDGCESEYEWCCVHWGTKWDAYDQDEPRITKNSATYSFACAWQPPEEFVIATSKMYPECTFVVSHGGNGPCGRFVLKNGVYLELSEVDYDSGPSEEAYDNEDDYMKAIDDWEYQYVSSHDEYIKEFNVKGPAPADSELDQRIRARNALKTMSRGFWLAARQRAIWLQKD